MLIQIFGAAEIRSIAPDSVTESKKKTHKSFQKPFLVTWNLTKIDLFVYLGHVPIVRIGEALRHLTDHVILGKSVSDAVIMRRRGVKSKNGLIMPTRKKFLISKTHTGVT